jgi:hypothetical protein
MVRSDEMGNGGFSLTGIDQAEILETISMISVTVIDFGKAEVRGLTTSGINSRWGMARRSISSPGCWSGADFKICTRGLKTP